MSRRRWIFILTIIIRSQRRNTIKEVGSRRWHKHRRWIAGHRWHKRRIILSGQNIFVIFNISSNNIFGMWLNKSISLYIFRISKKYALFTFRLQFFLFFIQNVSPCFTTKHMKVTYIWFNFTPCFFWFYTL